MAYFQITIKTDTNRLQWNEINQSTKLVFLCGWLRKCQPFYTRLCKLSTHWLTRLWLVIPAMYRLCPVIQNIMVVHVKRSGVLTPEVYLTNWGRVTHICVSKLTIIDSDNGLSSDRRQAIIWTNAGILLIRTSGTNFSEISSEIHTFSFKKMHSKMSFAKWRPFCLGLGELTVSQSSYVLTGPRHGDGCRWLLRQIDTCGPFY